MGKENQKVTDDEDPTDLLNYEGGRGGDCEGGGDGGGGGAVGEEERKEAAESTVAARGVQQRLGQRRRGKVEGRKAHRRLHRGGRGTPRQGDNAPSLPPTSSASSSTFHFFMDENTLAPNGPRCRLIFPLF